MKLNAAKTKLMLFNPSKTYDFMPDMMINNTELELVEETKLLGVVVNSDLSWAKNTEYIPQRA